VFFTLFCPDKAQNIISAIGILSFGILHGANDIKILVKKNSTSKPLLKLLYLMSYIFVVFLGVSIFFFFPALGLITFIAVSCYHFGEQHWQSKLIRIREKRLFFFTYGTLIFSILFIFHYPAINKIIFQISNYDLSYEYLKNIFIFSTIVMLLLVIKNSNRIKNLWIEFVIIVFLGIIFSQGSLLFGFGFYFIIWHSLPSLKSQIRFLYEGQVINPYIKYLKSGFIYWIFAIIGLVGFYFLGVLPKEQYISVFFSFLAAITFPHVVVMGLMFKSSN
tara:strand:- start:1156 stop:1983 length:828 start_codon:yes stop_codon:yes gene_type:complete